MSDNRLKLATEALARRLKNDPLTRRGIGRDWLAVIHPALVYPLLEEFEKLPEFIRYVGLSQGEKLRQILGRRVWIINNAPRTEVQYMPASELLRRYGDEIVADDLRTLKLIAGDEEAK